MASDPFSGLFWAEIALVPGAVGYSGLYYYGHRYYSSQLGRWISRDPIEEQGGLNLYVYVLNNAIGAVDPKGLKGCCGQDITGCLLRVGASIETAFNTAPPAKQRAACRGMLGLSGWEIIQLGGRTRLDFKGTCPTCKDTVTVTDRTGSCHYAAAVNYFLWGIANRLCHNVWGCSTVSGNFGEPVEYCPFSLAEAKRRVQIYRFVMGGYYGWQGDKSTVGQRLDWTQIGYMTGPYLFPSSPGELNQGCSPSNSRFRGTFTATFGGKDPNNNIRGAAVCTDK